MKSKKIFLPLIILEVLLINFPKTVYASDIQPYYYTYETYNNNWTWDYRNSAYYYIVDLSTEYANAVSQAAQNWFKTGHHKNPLYPMTRKKTQTGSPMDFYKKTLRENELGYTHFFVKGGTEVAFSYESRGPVTDWRYCKIYIDENQINSIVFPPAELKKVLMLHEMGHCFGLDHAASNARIMYPNLADVTATSVTFHDSAALVEKIRLKRRGEIK